ncbi:hypothetical protein CCR75_009259 [Bremia lactucae]|uniref:Uncharacterized protein n=1 Tax=Bremia lactucae TaxID=4779 RepID=A0A976FIW0_BRELC|nr:hypothetical protein CCR75_009259 [Bremia lactucae]
MAKTATRRRGLKQNTQSEQGATYGLLDTQLIMNFEDLKVVKQAAVPRLLPHIDTPVPSPYYRQLGWRVTFWNGLVSNFETFWKLTTMPCELWCGLITTIGSLLPITEE